MKYFNLDTDVTLGGNSDSDTVVASQKAIKIYIDNNSGGGTSNTGYTATNPALTPVSGVCSWTVTHNLNSTSVVCSLYSGSIEIQKNVSIDSANQITVSFNAISEVAAGSCTVVVFSKGANTPLVVDSSLSSSSENPVQNKVINTALTNKLDIDASNLSSTGQKVFDGQWVKSGSSLITGGTLPNSSNTRIEVDLSSYLPNDNYSYEVTLNGIVYVGNTDARNTLSVYGKDTEISHYVCRASKAGDSGAGNTIVDVGSSRKVVVDYWSANNGTFDLKMQGYRRIGTNQ